MRRSGFVVSSVVLASAALVCAGEASAAQIKVNCDHVVINNSSANLDQWYVPSTPITGSAGSDLFCDATSLITGGNKAPTSTRQCANVLGGATEPLP